MISSPYRILDLCDYVNYARHQLCHSIPLSVEQEPSQCDWNAAKRVLHYLKGTQDLGIIYHQEPTSGSRDYDHTTPWGYCNTNYVEDPHDQKSTNSYSFMLAGGPIAWKSKKQSLVALSTTEAEYYVLGVACQETVWLQQLCKELHMNINQPTPIYSVS